MKKKRKIEMASIRSRIKQISSEIDQYELITNISNKTATKVLINILKNEKKELEDKLNNMENGYEKQK